MKEELLRQLHEQYAINNNANLSTIVTLVVAVIAVIGCYGYVYVHTTLYFSCDFGLLVNDDVFYMDALLLIYLASVFVLCILSCLCAYQGVAQRKEQFIIYSIRKEYIDNVNNNIFPKGYSPYGKKGLKIVQGLYGELIKVFLGAFILLTLMLVKKLAVADYRCCCCYNSPKCLTAVFFVITFVIVVVSWIYCNCQIKAYKRREKEYKKEKLDDCDNNCFKCIYRYLKIKHKFIKQ